MLAKIICAIGFTLFAAAFFFFFYVSREAKVIEKNYVQLLENRDKENNLLFQRTFIFTFLLVAFIIFLMYQNNMLTKAYMLESLIIFLSIILIEALFFGIVSRYYVNYQKV